MYPFTTAKKIIELTERAETSCANLDFSPARIVSAISFHLVDEGIAKSVEACSLEAAKQDLCNRLKHLTISKDQWELMDNPQRLGWLLKQSRITVRSRLDGTAVLFA